MSDEQRQTYIELIIEERCKRYKDDSYIFQKWLRDLLELKSDKEIKEIYLGQNQTDAFNGEK